MKEYNESDAVALMAATLPEELRDNDSICEVLDLIYDYYDDNGDLDIDCDGDEDDPEIDDMVNFIVKYLKKNAPAVNFSQEQIAAMVRAEIEYEESLI